MYRSWECVDVHWCILQHIRYDKEPNHTPSNVDLIQLRDSPIATCNSDILQGDVQIILSYWDSSKIDKQRSQSVFNES